MLKHAVALSLLLSCGFNCAAQPASLAATRPPDRLLYLSTNLLVPANVDKAIALFARAHTADYTGVLLADSKFARLGEMGENYFANCRRLQAAAKEHQIEIIPAVFPIGYSNDLLWHNPNLAEALPVRSCRFTVQGGVATCDPETVLTLPPLSNLAAWSWHDETVKQDGAGVTVTNPSGNNARIVQKLKLTPFRQYHISVRIKTAAFKGTPEIKVLCPAAKGEANSLIFSSLGAKPTQDWTVHHAVFNSLENTEASLYLGCWDGSTGSLSWQDAKIEEVGLLNVVRRPGAPLSVEVRTSDATAPLIEGTDFEPIVDPRMGHPPALWAGEYEIWHEPPVIKLLKPLADGTHLGVSYHHVVTIHDGQVMICPSEPQTLDLLRDQAKRMHELWNAQAYWMSHDEIRCLNQDDACRTRNLSPGAILADNTRECIEILKNTNPGGRIYVWSDMFDPFHNAKPGNENYYLVNGDFSGSWEGLDKDVIIGAWYFDKRNDSLPFFANRGHPLLLAGYYDGPPGIGVKQITDWISAVPKTAQFRGVMYTTWENRFEDIESFAKRAWPR